MNSEGILAWAGLLDTWMSGLPLLPTGNHFFSIMTVGREAEAEKEGTQKRPSPRDNDRRVVLEFKVKLYPDDYPIRRQSQEILIPAK